MMTNTVGLNSKTTRVDKTIPLLQMKELFPTSGIASSETDRKYFHKFRLTVFVRVFQS